LAPGTGTLTSCYCEHVDSSLSAVVFCVQIILGFVCVLDCVG